MLAQESSPDLRPHSLVLYKQDAARVLEVGRKKIEIERAGGERVSVRHKDVELLHPGPLRSFSELRPGGGTPPGEVRVAWELLAGASTTLPELAELAYEKYTPATAWAVWQLLEDGLYFQGTAEEIQARTAEELEEEQATRAREAAEQAAWDAFLARAGAGVYSAEDDAFLQEVEALALKQYDSSRVLRGMEREESPEGAHALLLELGYWRPEENPHPRRVGLPLESPALPLPPLPDEAREDLTHLPAFAIDDSGSSDPDDALSVEPRPDALPGVRLWVHVADVAALVPPGSAADAIARERGASLYLPEGTVHMLPPAVTDRLGLGLAQRSPSLSLAIDLSEMGEIEGVRVVPAEVRVQRLTYAEADALLHAESQLEEAALQAGNAGLRADTLAETRRDLRLLAQIAAIRHERRAQHGAVDLQLPEVKVRVVDGEVVIRPLPPLRSRRLVLEGMLAAGEAVATYALENEIPVPFATQDPPDPVEDAPQGLAGEFARLRGFKRGVASTAPAPHAGLGLPAYTQATSPMRRYLDLVAHQQLRAFLAGAPLLDEQALLERIGAAEAARSDVRYAERLANSHWTLVYLLQNPGWEGDAVVVDQFGQRSKVIIPELALESQLYLRRNVPLNGTVRLTVSEVDLPARRAYFREL